MRMLAMAMLLIGVSGLAFANVTAPEIDAGSAGTAVALLTGTLLVIRGRPKK